MRLKYDPQIYIHWIEPAHLKVVKRFRCKYDRISRILDENPAILSMIDKDLQMLSRGNRKRRKSRYTSENLLRALIVHQIECTSFRETVVRISETPFLKEFIRLGRGSVMDFTLLNKAFKAIHPQTWRAINQKLGDYALAQNKLSPDEIRTDSTVVSANIHYPSDASLLWDSWRVLSRLLKKARQRCRAISHLRLHDKKAKRLFLFIIRYAKSRDKKRKRKVKRCFRKLLSFLERIVTIAEQLLSSRVRTLGKIAIDLQFYLSSIRTVMNVTERSALRGEKVPSKERIFSIYEPHAELIMRGKRKSPCEFGHSIWVSQTREKFITDHDVMERKIADADLTETIVDRHRDIFGRYPDVLAADQGFRGTAEKMQRVERKVKNTAIPKRLSDWADSMMPLWQSFRAGVEGSISVLKRAFRLAVCQYRGFKSFAASIGMGIVCHNLVNLAGLEPD